MKIVFDHREKCGGVIEELQKLGADIELAALQVENYVVSDRVAFKRKTVDDLFATMFECSQLKHTAFGPCVEFCHDVQ